MPKVYSHIEHVDTIMFPLVCMKTLFLLIMSYHHWLEFWNRVCYNVVGLIVIKVLSITNVLHLMHYCTFSVPKCLSNVSNDPIIECINPGHYGWFLPRDTPPCLCPGLSQTLGRFPLNSSPPGQNGRHFADDIFRCIFVNEKLCILIRISLKFVPKGPNCNKPVLTRFSDAYM